MLCIIFSTLSQVTGIVAYRRVGMSPDDAASATAYWTKTTWQPMSRLGQIFVGKC